MTLQSVVIPAPVSGAEAPEPAPEAYTGPDYIPEKFRNAADPVRAMAEAYAAAVAKISAPAETAEAKAAREATEAAAASAASGAGVNPVAKYSEEFETTGKLADASYAELAALGYPRALVDTHIAGVQALVANDTSTIMAAAGGAEMFEQIRAWGETALPQAERDAFNAALSKRDMTTAAALAQNFKSKYEEANGKNPASIVGGAVVVGASGGYATRAELIRDQGDPRYRSDAAFRESVAQRALKSNF